MMQFAHFGAFFPPFLVVFLCKLPLVPYLNSAIPASATTGKYEMVPDIEMGINVDISSRLLKVSMEWVHALLPIRPLISNGINVSHHSMA